LQRRLQGPARAAPR